MKAKFFILVLGVAMVLQVNAQSDYSSYLDKAMVKLDAGECESARKLYNVYKELAGKSLPSFEALLADCKKEYYSLGDVMTIDNKSYVVVYIRDGGKHGYAVWDGGWNNITYYGSEKVKQKEIPTYEELKLIYANRDAIRFYKRYWTCTRVGSCEGYTGTSETTSTYRTIDFSTGKETAECGRDSNGGVVLLIHRF